MKLKITLQQVLSCFIYILLIMAGCDQSQHDKWCETGDEAPSVGKFNFRHLGTIDDLTKNGIIMELDFEPDPASEHGVRCSHSIGFIQVVRTVSLKHPNRFFYPTGQKASRATEEGWYIDRPDGYRSPIYGLRDDGLFEPEKVDPLGLLKDTETKPAVMYDSPYRIESPLLRSILWQAITVPVCVFENTAADDDEDSDAVASFELCPGGELGYYCWSWVVNRKGKVTDVYGHPVDKPMLKHVAAAMRKWNSTDLWDTVNCSVEMSEKDSRTQQYGRK